MSSMPQIKSRRLSSIARGAILLASLAVASVTQAPAEILVVSPHPDDDILIAAGVTARALARGETVRVVYVTNGDAGGSSLGYKREIEAVGAQSVLGVGEDKLMFFGYPDGSLQDVWDTATTLSSQFTSPNTGLSATYANRGLGHVDYHTYRHGSPAAYNHPNMVGDMVDVLNAYLPTHIFITSEFDVHTDHSTSYNVLQEALPRVIASHPTYNPTVHKTQVWMSSLVWPNALDASAYFDEEPNLYDRTGLVWAERESLDVPPSMQLTMYGDNPKYMAVDWHTSQEGAYQFLGRFVHKDEFYWTAQATGSNAPPVPNAGFDRSVSPGAAVTLDGSASFDRNGDAVTFSWKQAGGPPVTLSGATTAHPSFVAPSGITQNALLNFELIVSDGTLTSVPDAINVRVVVSPQPPAPVNIAPLASSVTASSAADGQPPTAAIDGVIDGYPNDGTKEWSADGQTTGAWIQLGWSAPHVVNSVRLHDRPNQDDQIAAGTLRFSDGSTVPVGRLANPGAGVDVNFSSRSTTSVRFTVDSVVYASNIGLAELLVFESGTSTDLCAGVVCTASDACHVAGTCNSATGVCSNPTKANGSTCNDSNACTQTDTCQAGVCTGGSPVTCTASDQCHTAGTCNPTSGVCSNPVKANGSSCNDGNPCTQSDTCQSGVCTGGGAVTCTASDQCHTAGTCSPATGCSNPVKANGATCNDGNACTQTDTCQAGVCTGANAVTCTASDPCHAVGTCNASTGVCSNPTKANGSSCSDGNACTQTDTCQAGVCTGANSVTCTASDSCHSAGTCNSSTGVCSNPTKTDGSTCNDGNACTQTDTCQGGVCTGANPVTCTASDQCHTAGTCSPATGCSNPVKTNGTSCNDNSACTQTDTCQAGVCTGTSVVTCTANDQCHTAGTCNPSTGACSSPAKANGTTCSDGNACTRTDTCQAGVCTGASPVTCTASDQCHVAGTCSPSTGTCSNPAAANGTTCNDANACTRTDACQAGVCTGANPVTCTASDQCHVAGTCSAATGTCSNPAAANGTICSDGNACTTSDQCSGGVCTGTLAGAANHLVISQLQTRGDASSPGTDEFIEIYNPTGASINAAAMKLIYKPTGSSALTTILTFPSTGAAVVPSHGWILVARSGYNGVVTPEFTYSSANLSATGGTVYLRPSGGTVTCTSSSVIDKVAWGNGDCAETAPALAPGANSSVMRLPASVCGNGQDTNNNRADFVVMAPSTPRH